MMKKQIENSLLYNLEQDEVNQIINDSDLTPTIEFAYCIDADDILNHIDPFKTLYKNTKKYDLKDSDFGILADNHFAFDLLLNRAKSKNFILKEYYIELKNQKEKIAKFTRANNYIYDSNLEKELNLNNKIFLIENSSEIFFILSNYSESIYSKFSNIFKKKLITLNPDFEEKNFLNDEPFNKEDKNRITEIYKLFPRQRLSDFNDAVSIYKVFKLNDSVYLKNKRYIYFSSAYKTDLVLKELKLRIKHNDKDWAWLTQIINKHEKESLLFFRNKKYIFGFSVYKNLLNKFNFNQKSRIKLVTNLFKTLCTIGKVKNDEEHSGLKLFLFDLIFKKREAFEGITVLKSIYERLKKLSESDIHDDTFINQLIIKVQEFIKTHPKENYDEAGVPELINTGFSFILKYELINRLRSDEKAFDLDRGRDNIISLFNTLPPLFVTKSEYKNIKITNLNIYKSKVEQLILFASEKIVDKDRTNKELIEELLNGCEKNESSMNNLLFLFILIFIKFKSTDNKDSNELVYEICKKIENELKNVIKLPIEHKTIEVYGIDQIKFITTELNVLKLWANRRIGQSYNETLLANTIEQHDIIIYNKEYESDYRFNYSLFLTRLNFIYEFIQVNSFNYNEIYDYIDKTIKCGKEARDKIIENFDPNKNDFISHTLVTLDNSLTFCYCIKLDIGLYEELKTGKHSLDITLVKLKEELVALKNKRKIKGENVDKKNFKSKSIKQPVYSYVEAYIEYLESFFEEKEKIEEAFDAITRTLDTLEKEKNNRSFFLFCSKTLENLIEKRKENLTSPYESFIIKVDVKREVGFK